jgi:zinc protease
MPAPTRIPHPHRQALNRLLMAGLLVLGGMAWGLSQAAERVASIEGVSEYRLANGLRVVLVPDGSVDTVTVNITYLVGSRHEGYGEKGMAHLLEHMLFKGSTRFPNIKEEFVKRGARWNGTTAFDRTNYFETLPATAENLEFALAVEADRMVNAFVRKEDLDSEMTVVRNEFESGENNPGNILRQRLSQLAFPWHNYGRAIIGERSDIENVPIERLRAFYRMYYQPDNAVLLVGGRIQEEQVLASVEKHFGTLPRPERKLIPTYTSEPVQDGERSVVLRRTGDTQLVGAMYRIPAGTHPDYPAIDVLVHALSTPPTGRLHRMLVQTGKASYAWGGERALHDPGTMYFGAAVQRNAPLDPAREALLEVLESGAGLTLSAEDVERSRTVLLNEFEKAQIDSRSLVSTLSEFSAMGDWRLFFLYRERLRQVKLEDVRRVADAYLKPANRVLGVFVPTDRPERAPIPAAPDTRQALAALQGGARPDAGEAFDPTPENIEQRVIRRTLANGMRVALLPKKTRGGKVVANLSLYWGDEQSKAGRNTTCSLAGAMLSRGTLKRSRAELRDAIDRLKANVAVGGEASSIEAQRAEFPEALKLVAEVLREPAFPASEFEELKRASLTGIEGQRSDPGALAGERIANRLMPYPRGHWLAPRSIAEQIESVREATLEDARRCYLELFGATGAEFAAVGDFDPEATIRLLESLFGDWKPRQPFTRIAARHFEVPGESSLLRTPDKANAVLRAAVNIRMRDDHADFPAMVLGAYLLGGSSTSRLAHRVREKDGLSYSTFAGFSAPALDEAARFSVSSIFAPQNRTRVEAAIREELERALRDGFSEDEVAAARNGLLQARKLARSQDGALAARLVGYLQAGRTFEWDVALERRIAALTPKEILEALRRHLDLARLSMVSAGDFKD